MTRPVSTVMDTGGAGFIGSNLIRLLFATPDFSGRVVNVDKLTYAGNPANLADIEAAHGRDRYAFEQVDICDADAVRAVMARYAIDTVIHLAAESHVDRSILGPRTFIDTNILGAFTLLESARALWREQRDVLFHHVSTVEVFGSLGPEGYFYETTPYDPGSPYSASKASSDHLVRAYHHTYGLPATVSNCSNNYGPYQFPEKLIPVMILNLLEGKSLPVYGKGQNFRDWLYLLDHASAIRAIVSKSDAGETYNVGGENEWRNIDLVRELCRIVADATGKPVDDYLGLIKFVTDRPGHDLRYAINCDKTKSQPGWKQSVRFADGLESTVRWYLDHMSWVDSVRSGEYRKWIEANYLKRDR